jgi:hypothetical protein
MQPATAPPRDQLTPAKVVELVRDTPGLRTAAGCELLDMSLTVLDDLTDDFAGGTVTRESYATLHGSAQLGIARTLDWGRAIVRPYMLLESAGTLARFNLGAYFAASPLTELGESPVTHAVVGYDILDRLGDPVGEVYAVAAGAGYLATVEQILQAQGYTQYVIDQQAAASVLPSARTWAMEDSITWLTIVNDLLGSVGYQGIWSDWDGRLRVQPYLSPSQRASEWVYDVGESTSMLTVARTVERDYYRAPNRWVFYRSNNVDGPAPVEGDGVYTFVNQSDGPTSVDARGGRVITRTVGLDVADQAALVAAAQLSIDADLRLKTTLSLGTAPNPLHWHFDRLTLADPAFGPVAEVLGTKWTLPLGGGDMAHDWSVI